MAYQAQKLKRRLFFSSCQIVPGRWYRRFYCKLLFIPGITSFLHLLEEFLVFLVAFFVHAHKSVELVHYFGFNLKEDNF